jgi:hypothetical protein
MCQPTKTHRGVWLDEAIFGPVLWGRYSLFKRLSMIGAG